MKIRVYVYRFETDDYAPMMVDTNGPECSKECQFWHESALAGSACCMFFRRLVPTGERCKPCLDRFVSVDAK